MSKPKNTGFFEYSNLENNRLEFHINELDSFNDFEFMVAFFKAENFQIEDQLDGIFARSCKAYHANISITLHFYDDFGNYFFATDSKTDIKLIRSLAQRLTEKLQSTGIDF